MKTLRVLLRVVVGVLFVAGATGCGSGLRATGVQLGRSVNTDGTIGTPTTRFGPTDKIYVSVLTAGVGSGVVSVRWKYGDRVVGEPKKEVSYRDDAATEFHLQSPSGFPPGDYTVEAFLDGQSVGTKEFRVETTR